MTTVDASHDNTFLPPGKLRCVATSKQRNGNSESYALERIIRRLIDDYGYGREDIEAEFRIDMGSRQAIIDLAIFPPGAEHTQEYIHIIVECRREDAKPTDPSSGVNKLKSYMAASLNCRFGIWVGSELQVWEKAGTPQEGEDFVLATDIPRFGAYPSQSQGISESTTPILGSPDFPTEQCLKILESDASTSDKKAAMSSIGRKRDIRNKHALIHYTNDINPEVVLQAVRGLLVLRYDPGIKKHLKSLCNHPNDMVRDVVRQEVYGSDAPQEGPHTESPDFMKNVVVHGDVLQTLKHVDDASVHLTFTSPPYYNARDYSIYSSYEKYLDFLEDVFSEVHRITKEGRFFVLNTSPIIIPRAGRKYASRRYPVPFDIHARLAKMGWEFIDDIIWAKPEKSAKNRVAGFEVNRKPLTYKANPRTEYVMVYRKKSNRLIDWNLRQYPFEDVLSSKVDDDFERSNVWEIPPTTDKVHSAVFPLRLCEQVVKLYSFKGDLVFDPFAGSGTLGKAALQLGRYCFLTEIMYDYIERIGANVGPMSMVSDKPLRSMDVDEFISSKKDRKYQ